MPISPESLFQLANLSALVCWIILILWPGKRPALLTDTLRWGAVTAFSLVYSTLALLYFFRFEGSFDTLAGLRQLFQQDVLLLAGWIHYLAFDLFIGVWMAEKADTIGLSRLIQVPILFLGFMLGPIGWLAFVIFTGIRKNQHLLGARES